jgi:hypothetical protein
VQRGDRAGCYLHGHEVRSQQQRSKADAEHFNWYSDDSVLLEKQLRTAVYLNQHDDLVIRQEADYRDNEVFIFIARQNIMEFIDKLCDIAGIPSFPPKGQP